MTVDVFFFLIKQEKSSRQDLQERGDPIPSG